MHNKIDYEDWQQKAVTSFSIAIRKTAKILAKTQFKYFAEGRTLDKGQKLSWYKTSVNVSKAMMTEHLNQMGKDNFYNR